MDEARTRAALLLALLLCSAGVHAEPDEEALGKSQAYPVGAPPTWYTTPYRVGSWSALDRVGVPVRAVARGADVMALPEAAGHPPSATAGATSATRSTTTWSGAASPAC
jgi:hypothetical protein